MLIIPAIDIQDGCVVRLVQGRADKKVYSRDPLKTAKHWVKQGAKFLHIVDLDGAFSGSPKNLNTAREIAGNIGIPVEFGGGVRSEETIKMLIDGGVRRVVLGTKAVQDKSFLKKAFSRFGDRVIVSIDAKGGDVLIEGWKSSSKGIKALEFAKYLKELGFTQIIYTDTQKDGTLTGPNIKGVKALLKETGLKIISSGGISKLEDVYKLKKLDKLGLSGIIIGKALYEGKFTLTQALKL
ncbi:MAG: 1-(5-phosphoribosyl)-5-[(5-phosphoribosylamino)methylideneamino]imidazole-4-carboxamide isomerase [Candidatus Omnitrophica bacterium]|nr:1-(5-phosphoribosyl)-5-[(5-phosphoribosylamino)methylideneamino]imidazole-4-carboxamide isomerase [Candidatus Omnitrophota bacterium]